jgi:hypothetical protein
MSLAGGNLRVVDRAIEAFFWRITKELVGQRDMFFRGETETVNDFFDFEFSVLNSLGNLDFLFTAEKFYLTHLFEIHSHRVVEPFDYFLGILFIFRLGFDTRSWRFGHFRHFDLEGA